MNTDQAYQIRLCTRCKEVKAFTEFYPDKHSHRKDGLRQYCKKCCAEIHTNWVKKHQDRLRKGMKLYRKNNRPKIKNTELKHEYGITLAEYNQLFQKQNGICAICLQPETMINRSGKLQMLSVDHNHKTGQIRGLLCIRCNWILGKMEENINLFLNAANYLRNHQ